MIYKTSIFLIGAIAFVFLMSAMTTEASAFEPTKKEQKIIEKYVQITLKVDRFCSDNSNDPPMCDKLEERQMRLLFKLNDLGIFADDQQPDLRHLTEEYNGTREAAQAGIEPIEIEIPTMAELSCSSCEDDPKTMYVKSAYKEPYSWFGIPLWAHHAGDDSKDISTGEMTNKYFSPIWFGINSGVVPYCQTSSIDLPANADYSLGLSVRDTNGLSLLSSVTTESSHFVWYDPFDQIGKYVINNITYGMNIYCSLTGVTVN